MKHWYAVMTNYNREQAAESALNSRGISAYCPLTLTDKRRITAYAAFRHLTEPLFPRYLFVQMDEGEDDFYPITKTPGITRIVKMTEREDGYLYPTIIPDEIIEGLKALEDEQGIHSNYQVDYQKGDRVRVVKGIFKDLSAEIATISGIQRVGVLIEMMGSFKNIELDYRDIEPA